MADQYSFDIVCEVSLQEVDNAVNQAMKEIGQRYDFKGSISRIELDKAGKKLTLTSEDETRLEAVVDILQSKLVKRGVSLKALEYGKVEAAAGSTVRREITLISELSGEQAKDLVKRIKNLKLKVQASIQEGKVRVAGKSKDDLQRVIQSLREADLPLPLNFTNYR